MKTMFRLPLVVLAALLLFVSASAQAQQTPRYKDVVVENPNAEADMKVVSDFINALVSGDLAKARSLASPTYIGRGPAATDSANVDKVIQNWQGNHKTQSDRKVTFVTQTFKVLSGALKGNWVSLWGDYTFTQAGKTIKFPFQYTAGVADGKILGDRIYYDVLSIYTQLGFKVTPPETSKK
ncbi:nuclear transport factor 2 family protein [Spirosoma fluviale]|uniref:SnoaL-like domain-containing protein n=1 Tax=Spirosoma fluviale TaxID=1597977 RepID=A0A286GQJ2_9BACT|nr:nuclear transport factor 2 family protein [Spirosoma fluviale]SOD97456.1 SnoaL-like domain-containing protein [Spirosoma fluviale]